MTPETVPAEAEKYLSWPGLCAALQAGHGLARADIQDLFMYRDPDTVLSRHAWIDGLGIAVKTATVFPGNKAAGKPTTGGCVSLYSDRDGSLEALVDFQLVTQWKTAGDSLLAASKLARKDSRNILIVGAGAVATTLRQAYGSLFPTAQFSVWSRTPASSEGFAHNDTKVQVARDLEAAVRAADIVTCATMATQPLIRGDWLQPGQHIDLIGAYRPDMREVDDVAMQRARIFVDSRDTTLDHIGELMAPLAAGAIGRDDVLADFYDLGAGAFARTSPNEITLFKNGGGAHLDLMTSKYILQAWRNR
jgi:ornithine cyclodeaminase/alanine dehydrogenase-like protein (mu-crystallin family)